MTGDLNWGQISYIHSVGMIKIRDHSSKNDIIMVHNVFVGCGTEGQTLLIIEKEFDKKI